MGGGVTLEQTQGKPPLEWFNSIFNRIDKNALYLLQQGVPEWSADVLYPIGAIIKVSGNLYKAKRQNTNLSPDNSPNYWEAFIEDGSLTKKGIVKLSSAVNSTAENQASTPKAVKTAYDLANNALPLTGGTATGGITAPTLTATTSATIGGVSVTGLSGNLYAAGLQLLSTSTGFKRLTFSTGGTTQYIKLAEGTITRTEIANISLLISGTGNYANQQSSTTLLEFSARAGVGLRVTHLTTTASGQPTYGYVTTSGTVELWAKLPAFQSAFSVTEMSSNHVSKTVSMVSSISSISTEPENIVYIEPILQITTANISSLFENSLTESGYQKLPNGLIMQWQNNFAPTGSNITLPISFPNKALTVIVGNSDRQGSGVDNAYGYVVDNSTVFVALKGQNNTTNQNFKVSYIAIGY